MSAATAEADMGTPLERILMSLAGNRCYACGWTLSVPSEGGCQPFNCSMRYEKPGREHDLWLKRAGEMEEVRKSIARGPGERSDRSDQPLKNDEGRGSGILNAGSESQQSREVRSVQCAPPVPDGYAVVMSAGYFVGIWRDEETATKILHRSPSVKDERVEPMVYAKRLDRLQAELDNALRARCAGNTPDSEPVACMSWEASEQSQPCPVGCCVMAAPKDVRSILAAIEAEDTLASPTPSETAEPFVKAVTVTLPDGSPVAAPCAISGCQYGNAVPSAGASMFPERACALLANVLVALDDGVTQLSPIGLLPVEKVREACSTATTAILELERELAAMSKMRDGIEQKLTDAEDRYTRLRNETDMPPATAQRSYYDIVQQIVRRVAEIPDRDSPPDQPEMLLVTTEELTNILREMLNLPACATGDSDR